MAKTVTCPKCKNPISLAAADGGRPGRVTCSSCGSSFGIQRKTPAPAPAKVLGPAAPVSTKPPDAAWADFGDGFDDPAATTDDDPFGDLSAFDAGPAPGRRIQPPVAAPRPVASAAASNVDLPKRQIPVGILVGGGVAGLLFLLIAIGGIFFVLNRGDDGEQPGVVAQVGGPGELDGEGAADDPDADAGSGPLPKTTAAGDAEQSDFGPLARTPHPVVFTQPVEGVTANPSAFYQSNDVDKKLRFVKTNPMAPPEVADSTEPVDSSEQKPEPQWQIPADPMPPGRNYTIAEDLKIVFDAEVSGGGDERVNETKQSVELYPSMSVFGSSPAILADQRGPFLIPPPRLQQSPIGAKHISRNSELIKVERFERPVDDFDVIDIRTGKPAGQFSWRIPYWLFPTLSPDGSTLVGPYHDLKLDDNWRERLPAAEKIKKEWEQNSRSLFIWQRDTKTAPKRIPMSGSVRSMMFATDRALVVYINQPEAHLEVWNTQTAQKLRTIPLPGSSTVKPNYGDADPLDLTLNPPTTQNELAVSPGGKYAAVMSAAGVMFVSLVEGKVLGTLPLTPPKETPYVEIGRWKDIEVPAGTGEFSGKWEDCLGIEFLPGGDQLVVAYALNITASTPQLRLMTFDITTGTLAGDKLWNDSATGPGILGPDARMYVLTNNMFDGEDKGMRGEARLFDLDKRAGTEVTYRPPTILRFPDNGPLLTLGRVAGDARDRQMVISSMRRDTFEAEIEPVLAVDDYGQPKRPPADVADRSSMQMLSAEVPQEFTPIANFSGTTEESSGEEPAATSIQTEHWPEGWSDTRAVFIPMEHITQSQLPVAAQLLDLTQTPVVEPSPPFEIFGFGLKTGAVHDRAIANGSYNPIGMSPDGRRFAVADAEVGGRMEVWSIEPKRLFAFRSGQRDGELIFWTGWSNDQTLWTLQAGTLSSWKIDDQKAIGQFAIAGDYRRPMIFSPDRKLLLASRGTSFDLLDTETGQCRARLTLNPDTFVFDAAFGPDGRQLAVVFASSSETAETLIRGTDYNFQRNTDSELLRDTSMVVGLWDLSTGEVRINDTPIQVIRVAWAGPEHLILCRPAPAVYDLKLDRLVFWEPGSMKRSPDGRLWHAHAIGSPPMPGFSPSSLTANLTDQERPFFAEDRRLYDPLSETVQVELDMGDEGLARKYAPALLEHLQSRGWKIGPSPRVIRVTTHATGSNEEIRFENGQTIEIPQIAYHWQLLDEKGQEISRGVSVGRFNARDTKYATRPDLEIRKRIGDDAFFFGAKDPETAILEEILELGSGLADSPLPTVPRLIVGGQYLDIPVKLSLSTKD